MELRKWIESIEWYKGNSHAEKQISASQLGGDLLPIYLAKVATKDSRKTIGSAWVGSAFHFGMENMMSDDRYGTEVSQAKTLSNGWTITGTADVADYEMENIHDYKTLSASSYTKKKKEVKFTHSQISVQLATLLWLNDFRGSAFAEFFITDLKPWKRDHPATGYQQLPVSVMPVEELEGFMVAKTNQLQRHLDDGTVPVECENVMWMVYDGNRIKLKCEYYCDYKNSCPHYAKKTNKLAVTKHTISGW